MSSHEFALHPTFAAIANTLATPHESARTIATDNKFRSQCLGRARVDVFDLDLDGIAEILNGGHAPTVAQRNPGDSRGIIVEKFFDANLLHALWQLGREPGAGRVVVTR